MIKKIIITSAITCLIVNLVKMAIMACKLTTAKYITPDMQWFINFGNLSLTGAGMKLLWVPTTLVQVGESIPFPVIATSVAAMTFAIYKAISMLHD